MRGKQIFGMVSAALLVWMALPEPLLACEVCYGAAESPMLDGMNKSILFMLGMTYFVIAGLGTGFFFWRRKARLEQSQAAGEGEGE